MRHVTRACAWSLERVIVFALAACALVVGPEFRRVRGIIDIGDARSRTVVAPDTVMVGVSFLVDATTFGSGSCTQPDGSAVSVHGALAEIDVYDRERVRGACTTDLSRFPRSVLVQFDVAGLDTLRVRGRALNPTADRRDSVVVVERVVVVR
jgi:hypothetical protein